MAAPPTGEVDTLNMLFEKLENLFNESQNYYESFLDTNNMYKKGQVNEKEFFQQLGDYVVAYSALEFLAVKVLFEIKKVLDKGAGGKATTGTQSPGLMPGMGQPGGGMMGGGSAGGGMMQPPPQAGTKENPVGRPPSIVSGQGSGEGTMPSPDPYVSKRPPPTSQEEGTGGGGGSKHCSSCGAELRPNAKFCTKCGTKV